MHGRRDGFTGRWTAPVLALLAAGAFALVTGCGGGSPDNPPDLVVNRTMRVPHGVQPLWLDAEETRFLFSYDEATGPVGLFLSDLEGLLTTIYDGPQNHDYVVSHNGEHIAFSTPGIGGGVIVATPDGATQLVLADGRQPAFIDNATLAAVDRNGVLVSFDLDGSNLDTLISAGTNPVVSADGRRIAFLATSSNPGFALRYVGRDTATIVHLADKIGMDAVWDPSRPVLYASQLGGGYSSNVVEVQLNGAPNNISTVFYNASHPSVSRDGSVLFANKVTNGQQIALLFVNLHSGDREEIPNASFASAGNGRRALVQQTDGIYSISF